MVWLRNSRSPGMCSTPEVTQKPVQVHHMTFSQSKRPEEIPVSTGETSFWVGRMSLGHRERPTPGIPESALAIRHRACGAPPVSGGGDRCGAAPTLLQPFCPSFCHLETHILVKQAELGSAAVALALGEQISCQRLLWGDRKERAP